MKHENTQRKREDYPPPVPWDGFLFFQKISMENVNI